MLKWMWKDTCTPQVTGPQSPRIACERRTASDEEGNSTDRPDRHERQPALVKVRSSRLPSHMAIAV
jgi:hypothetical protein